MSGWDNVAVVYDRECTEVTSEMFAGAVGRRSVNNRAKVTVTITYCERGYCSGR